MKKKLVLTYIFILFISGILMYFSHPPNLIFFLTFFCLIPLLFFIDRMKKFPVIFWGCLFSGFVYYLFSFSWILNMSIESLENSEFYFYLLKIIFFILLSFVSALFIGFWGVSVKYLHNRKNLFNYFVLSSFSLVLLEYFRSFFISLILYGEGGLIGAHWTFGVLGYNLVDYLYLSKLASFGGVYLLSFLVVFINLIIISYLKKDFPKKNYLRMIIILFFVILFFNFPHNNLGDEINVGVIQTGPDKKFSSDHINEILSGEFSDLSLIVLPENLGSKSFVKETQEAQYMDIVPNENQLVVFSKDTIFDFGGDLKSMNMIYYLDGENSKFNSYGKTFLMPFGEYAPYFLWIFDSSKLEKEHIVPGESLETIKFKNNTFGALACGSFMSPILFSSLVREGKSEILINVASNSAFLDDKKYRELSIDYSRLRALENNRYFVQSSHSGYSFVLDNCGRILTRTNSFDSEIFSSNGYLIHDSSFYSRFGDWFVFLGIVLFLVFAFRNLFKP